MRVCRAGYKDRSGEQRKSAKWYLDFADDNQRHKNAQDTLYESRK